MTEPMVLPADVVLVPVKDLPESVRKQIAAEDDDYALTRPHSRTPSRILDAQAADLLKEFREPVTIVQAVIRYSEAKKTDPEQALEDAFPMLERLAAAHLLVPADSEDAGQIRPSLKMGMQFAGTEVLRCVQVLEDTEVYEVKTGDGENAALKILRPNAGADVARRFERETAILEWLDHKVSPKLLENSVDDERRYLLMEWCPGVESTSAALELRRRPTPESRRLLLPLCCAIVDAYAWLHSKKVIHSDIHPRNILVDGTAVKIIDFGLARISGVEHKFRRAERGGVGFFFEPEYAKAARDRKTIPASSALGEQYGLAALIYFLVTGGNYLDFSSEKSEMLRQIAEESPLQFSRRGVEPWPDMEQVLAKALMKDPAQRYVSVAEFAEKLKAIAVPEIKQGSGASSATERGGFPAAKGVLQEMLARLDTEGAVFGAGVPRAPKVSVTFGAAGVAYALYRIACALEDARLLTLADLWATRAARDSDKEDAFYNHELEVTPEVVGRVSPYHTVSGVHLVQGLIGQAMGDVVSQQGAVDKFIVAVNAAPCDNLDLTLGRSGTLLGTALLLDAVDGNAYVNTSGLRDFGNRALEEMWQQIDGFASIRECRQISYSGIAHGWAGILYAAMRWSVSSRTNLPSGVEERLEQLAHLASHSGHRARWRWRVRLHRSEPGGTYLPGWCNGSAGFVHLWLLAYEIFKKEAYLELAEKAGVAAWESEGEIGNLCCGFAGQAYASLSLYRRMSDRQWLQRAQAQAEQAAASMIAVRHDHTAKDLVSQDESLYKGKLGVAVLAAELERPEFAAMPFFERES
jgi:serine/threonine protein kinase